MKPSNTPVSARQLFSFGARYLIDPQSSLPRITEDARCFLEAALAALDVMISGLEDHGSDIQSDPSLTAKMMRGISYNLQMVDGMVGAIEGGLPSLSRKEVAA